MREISPFLDPITNVLLIVGGWQIVATFLGALVVSSNSAEMLVIGDLGFGILLLVLNFALLATTATWCVRSYRIDEERKNWKHALSDEQVRILDLVMHKDTGHDSAAALGSAFRHKIGARDPQDILKQYMLHPNEVELSSKLGAGAFGEVFKARVHGHTVVAKTMKEVTEENATKFRSELLLTATLRHPKIVNFVGCTWGKQLTCMLLEFVPNGSLGDMLERKEGPLLLWSDPLLALACDVAQGMAYLHGREYFDEESGEMKRCILHRDLKPDNCLVTEFNRGKLADFGTSRAKTVEAEFTMTAVGTPMFAAPELMRGENYDEKIDVYSFGMTLACMGDEEHIVTQVNERYRVAFGKAKALKNPSKALRAIWEGEFAPFRDGDDSFPFAPPAVKCLMVQCLSADPAQRPTFQEVVGLLTGTCAREIEAGVPFGRRFVGVGAAALAPDVAPATDDEQARFVEAQRQARPGIFGGRGGQKARGSADAAVDLDDWIAAVGDARGNFQAHRVEEFVPPPPAQGVAGGLLAARLRAAESGKAGEELELVELAPAAGVTPLREDEVFKVPQRAHLQQSEGLLSASSALGALTSSARGITSLVGLSSTWNEGDDGVGEENSKGLFPI